MNVKAMLCTVGLGLLVTGCSLQPSHLATFDASAAKIKAINDTAQKEHITNLAFPTKIPFKVTLANMPTPAINPVQKHAITYFLGDKQHALEIDASTLKQKSIDPSATTIAPNQVMTHLGDGTKAIYGRTSTMSALAWVKNDVQYIMTSVTNKNKPDLNEQQLIQIANSFK